MDTTQGGNVIETKVFNLDVELASSLPRVVWTPNKDWGDQVFIDAA